MIQRLLQVFIRKFEKQNRYDAKYMHHINQHSQSATLRLMMFSSITGYHGDNVDVWAGAALHSTLSGDCGPCAQLVLDRCRELGVNGEKLKACLAENWSFSGDVGLGFRFSQAALGNGDSLQALRTEIRSLHGERTLIAASYASSSFQVYPLIKRSLGYNLECQQLTIDDQVFQYRA